MRKRIVSLALAGTMLLQVSAFAEGLKTKLTSDPILSRFVDGDILDYGKIGGSKVLGDVQASVKLGSQTNYSAHYVSTNPQYGLPTDTFDFKTLLKMSDVKDAFKVFYGYGKSSAGEYTTNLQESRVAGEFTVTVEFDDGLVFETPTTSNVTLKNVSGEDALIFKFVDSSPISKEGNKYIIKFKVHKNGNDYVLAKDLADESKHYLDDLYVEFAGVTVSNSKYYTALHVNTSMTGKTDVYDGAINVASNKYATISYASDVDNKTSDDAAWVYVQPQGGGSSSGGTTGDSGNKDDGGKTTIETTKNPDGSTTTTTTTEKKEETKKEDGSTTTTKTKEVKEETKKDDGSTSTTETKEVKEETKKNDGSTTTTETKEVKEETKKDDGSTSTTETKEVKEETKKDDGSTTTTETKETTKTEKDDSGKTNKTVVTETTSSTSTNTDGKKETTTKEKETIKEKNSDGSITITTKETETKPSDGTTTDGTTTNVTRHSAIIEEMADEKPGFVFNGYSEVPYSNNNVDNSEKTDYEGQTEETVEQVTDTIINEDGEEEEVTTTTTTTTKTYYPSYVNITVPEQLKSPERDDGTTEHILYIVGYPDGEVKPMGNITREEVTAAFYRLLNEDFKETIETEAHNFSDVSSDRWSNKSIATMAKGSFIVGDENGDFDPGRPITRAEFAVIASKFAPVDAEPAVNYFTDISGHWAEKYILIMAGQYWISGYGDGTFNPNAYITRAEAMSIINRMLVRYADHDTEYAKQWPDVSKDDWYYDTVVEATTHNYFARLSNGWQEFWVEDAAKDTQDAVDDIMIDTYGHK